MDLFDRMWSVQDAISKYDFREGLKAMLDIATAGNQILQFNEQWKTQKDEPETVKAVLNLCIQYLGALSFAMHPFMPDAAARLRKLLAVDPIVEQGAWVTTLDALSLGEKLIPEGHILGQPEHLFSRVDDEWIQLQLAKLNEMSVAATATATTIDESTKPVDKPPVSYDDFAKLDIRTAKILAAESVPKADKLLKLTLEVNGVQRTVVSGIAKHYTPEELPGKHVVILANLEPRKIRGVESQGMILMAESGDGKLHFIQAAEDESGMQIS
jgi:methionyl-tRNA synthetase